MKAATKKLARVIAAELRGIDKRSPVEQMAAYFASGLGLHEAVENGSRYGVLAMRDIAGLVPGLEDEGRAYEIRDLSMVSEEGKEFILDQTKVGMSNGEHLTLGHWLWLMRHKDWVSPADPGEWVISQLAWLRKAWLRKASPPADVLDHVEAVWSKRHNRELEEAQDEGAGGGRASRIRLDG